jgi:hypothetical protein
MTRLVVKYNARFSDLGVRIQFVEPFPAKVKSHKETFLCDFSANRQLVGIEILFGMSSEGIYHIDPLSALENQNPALTRQARFSYDEKVSASYLELRKCSSRRKTVYLPGAVFLDEQDRLVGLEVSWQPGDLVATDRDQTAEKPERGNGR